MNRNNKLSESKVPESPLPENNGIALSTMAGNFTVEGPRSQSPTSAQSSNLPAGGLIESPQPGNVATALLAAAAGGFSSPLHHYMATQMAIAQQQQLMLLQQQGNNLVQDQTRPFNSGPPLGFNSSAAFVQLLQQATSNTPQFASFSTPQPEPITEQCLTTTTDGTILSVTTPMIDGFLPDSFVMKSAYDSVHAQDVAGLRAIATNFWERGNTEVTAYIRRQTSSGRWVWLSANLERYVEIPVPGAIIREKLVKDDKRAKVVARTTRISALLASAVEAAHSHRETVDASDQNNGKSSDVEFVENKEEKNSTSLISALEAVSSGVCLDLSMITLSSFELKMITYVLTGRLQIEDLGQLVVDIFNSNVNDIVSALDAAVAKMNEKEKMQPKAENQLVQSPFQPVPKKCPPLLSVLNLSYTNIGNQGLDILCEVLFLETPTLKTLDVGFCGIDERGLLRLGKAFYKRKKQRLPSLQGLILSGNAISYKAAKELGGALSTNEAPFIFRKKRCKGGVRNGYDSEDEEDDADFDEVFLLGGKKKSSLSMSNPRNHSETAEGESDGLILLHLACSSLKPDSLHQLLVGLGHDCPLRELHIASNNFGPEGASVLVSFLEGSTSRPNKKKMVMPKLDRLDISNNNLGNDGIAEITRLISKRMKKSFVDLRLSSNNIEAAGVETLMNKLLQHNLLSLCLDNNTIGDRGCQLIAASLPSMHSLLKLSLSFNSIGSRGINALMRSLIGCESIQSLSLSGNVMKISGAISMGFALAQHPRLCELDLDNCCLSQVAQCHIVSGMISNRWVPMRSLSGFRVAPPMIVMGALDHALQHISNDECFKLRRDMQMKTISTWMQPSDVPLSNRSVATNNMEDSHGESAYHRMLDWLSRVPFDEDELADLHSYFFDLMGSDEDSNRASNAHLRHRGDLLANFTNKAIEEIKNAENDMLVSTFPKKLGYNIETSTESDTDTGLTWNSLQKYSRFRMVRKMQGVDENKTVANGWPESHNDTRSNGEKNMSSPSAVENLSPASMKKRKTTFNGRELGLLSRSASLGKTSRESLANLGSVKGKMNESLKRTSSTGKHGNVSLACLDTHGETSKTDEDVMSASQGEIEIKLSSQKTLTMNNSEASINSDAEKSNSEENGKESRKKARISMFPEFKEKLDRLKDNAQILMDREENPHQQDLIAQDFAQQSLTLLRQLRYHCMNSGLDGWRIGTKMRRKVLIIDDSLTTRKLVSRAFQKANFIVDTAENGKKGLDKLKEMIYDIAFMDIDMPVMNGYDATKELRLWEDNKRPGARQPICALTGTYVDDFARTQLKSFKEAGVDVMESKPCNIPRLFKVVDDVSPMFSDLSISVTNFSASEI
uniref:Response regulatory domain-containing protein n=2 Tax=Corethron hystrix TaxID=216773 RepID=A0A7S1FQS7_9STRA|mmetsp:Transcript_20335/g.46131  ORF Transcript_20335/g.46131 Transcript_20335/m.46131 type:complete len:1354 (+) Transcript_20335:409-4470(+)